MPDPIRIGVLGGGGILAAHAPALKKANDLGTVIAAAEPDEKKHDRLRELLGPDIAIHPDYETLLREADIDAVDILLPHDLHLPATLAAAQHGKHVLVEKVMARNIEECDRMIAACDQAGVTLTVCHDRRYGGEWSAMKKLTDSGLLGEIHYWKLDHNQDVNPAKYLPWAASRDRLGGGAIMSCLTHQIDALRWYGGEVESVMCMGKVVPERMKGETYAVIAGKMTSGALAHLSINWETRQHNSPKHGLWYEMVQVCGSEGEAYYMSGKGVFARRHDDKSPGDFVELAGETNESGYTPVKSDSHSGHEGCTREWLKMLHGQEHAVTTTGTDSRGTVEIAEAAVRSWREGREITLPIEPEAWR